eukprot:g73505.t1
MLSFVFYLILSMLSSFAADSAQLSCALLLGLFSSCQFWTYENYERLCYMKSSDRGRTGPVYGYISGPKKCGFYMLVRIAGNRIPITRALARGAAPANVAAGTGMVAKMAAWPQKAEPIAMNAFPIKIYLSTKLGQKNWCKKAGLLLVKLALGDYQTTDQQDYYLKLCAAVPGVTACEAIWGQSNRGCYAHTSTAVFAANGVDRHNWGLDSVFRESCDCRTGPRLRRRLYSADGNTSSLKFIRLSTLTTMFQVRTGSDTLLY